MVGMFFGFTRLYPQWVTTFRKEIVLPQPQVSFSEELAPFVRGILSGIESATVSSIRITEPLQINMVSGYKNGIKSALLASKNWYNLDRQLFRVRGIAAGVMTSLDTSKTTIERATLAYQIKLIQQIQAALATNLEELLSSNQENRRSVLEDYVSGLKKLASEGAIEVENMQRSIDEATLEFGRSNDLAKQFSENFTAETKEFVTENIDLNLEQFLKAQKKAEESRVAITSTSQIFKRLKPFADRLPTVISAIEANFEALAAGIKVAPTKGVNLPIIKEES